MSLIDHKETFRVERDECGDAKVDCSPTGAPLGQAAVFDNGPGQFDVWVFETARPTRTANAIIATLARHGFAAKPGQTGDREVIVQVRHDGDRASETAILRLVHAKARRRLSDDQKARLAARLRPFQFSAQAACGGHLRAPGSKIAP
jgi:hypothetical protein